jgi:hypothetical protein
MSRTRRVLDRRSVLWTAAVIVPIVAGVAIIVPMSASGAVDLPDKTARELIEFAGASEVTALSGTIEQTSELGLPDLGALTGSTGEGGGGSAADIDDVIALATGSHTAKVYLDGERARLQVLDQLGERNVYVDGAADAIWYVDSETKTATRVTIPAHAAESTPDPDDTLPTPDEMLDQALSRLDETTEVTVGTDSSVAGRDVYELILAPRTGDTLVGEVRFAIDGENGAAVAASVTARGASAPAFEVAYTQIDFSAPDPAVFAFEPGDDVTVTERDLSRSDAIESAPHDPTKTDAAHPVVIGEGWSAVVELPDTSLPGEESMFSGLDAEQLALLESLTTAVEGGRALQTALVSVLITDDGRVLGGAVPVSRLVEAAQTGR